MFIYDDRDTSAGQQYQLAFEDRLAQLKSVLDLTIPTEGIDIDTFYSNAEISALFKSTRDVRFKLVRQGDKVEVFGGGKQ